MKTVRMKLTHDTKKKVVLNFHTTYSLNLFELSKHFACHSPFLKLQIIAVPSLDPLRKLKKQRILSCLV